jgi:hypothetical protein
MNFLLANVPLGKKYKIPFPVLLWFTLAFVAVLLESLRHAINNYEIFKGVFWHTVHQMNLYNAYPADYHDTNHYGPLFSLVIAPFAMLPDWLGVVLWSLTNAAVLFIAIKQLGFEQKKFYTILLIGAIELMSSTHHVQFNPMVGAWLILSYVMVEKEKDLWATLFIAAGFLCKLYGIAGLTFFLFSQHKVKFAGYFIMWMAILFCLPMLISSPAFIVQSYQDWFNSLRGKDAQNAAQSLSGGQQDISIIGVLRRSLRTSSINDLMVLAPAALLYALPLLRFSQYKYAAWRLRYLALALITIVIYSSSAESVTYVIAVTGVAIWYVLQEKKTAWTTTMLVILFFVTILSPTDLCPPPIQHFIRFYALKALPCFIVWLLLIREAAFKTFSPERSIT